MKNLADAYVLERILSTPIWREDVIGWDGDKAVVRCPWITGQDPYVDEADRFDRKTECK